MIKLIYDTIVADSEALQAALIDLSIPVIGISTIESPDTPQTLIFVEDETDDSQKLKIDDEVKLTLKKRDPIAPDTPAVKEEAVIDEPRKL